MASVSARRAPPPRATTNATSTTTKRRKSPPQRIKKSVIPETEDSQDTEMDNAVIAADAEVGDHRDDRSSSLSDPEDEHEALEGQNGIEHDAVSGGELPAHTSLEVDSEAETERLSQTPQKLRKQADSLGRTPSKLSQTATADEELSDPPSPLPAGVGAASSTSTIATAGQKRKRSDTADSPLTSTESDLGESPRKRSHEMTADDQIRREEEAIEDAEPIEEAIDRAEETPTADEVRDTPPIPAKGPKGRRGKQKGKKQKDAPEELALEQEDETIEPTEEPSEEDPVKAEEQRKAKKEASDLYDDVAKHFRNFKDQLFNERLATLNSQLHLLSQPECSHPEYLRQVACVDGRLQKQIQECHAFFNYKLRSIRDRTLGERTQLHGQYFQHVRQLREDVLYKLGEDWYAIQKERRQNHQTDGEDNLMYMFNPKRSAQIKQQEKYNMEVSILSGVAAWHGFPAAPDINGAEGDMIEEDLMAMKISRRPTQPVSQPRPLYLSGPTAAKHFTDNDPIAHQQYLEQNPWARPQAAPIHAYGTPGISHTPDWADSSAGKHVRPTANLGARNSSPFTTPLNQKHMNVHEQQHISSGAATIGINSDGVGSSEAPMPSSVAAAPPTADRMAFMHQHGASSNPTSPLAFPKPRENGTTADPPGFRNISGMSGASTIDAPPDGQAAPMDDSPTATSSSKTMHLPPVLTAEASSGPQAFPTSQIHRHPNDEKAEVYAGAGFRPQEGAFGTPAPLQALPPSSGPGASS